MIQSESLDELALALIAAKQEFKKVQLTKTNPMFRSKYATLEEIQEATDPYLHKHDLCIIQFPETVEGVPGLVTMLLHSSGQFIRATVTMEAVAANKAQTDIQALGSNITYMRRYGRAAVLGIVSDEDTDGNSSRPQRTKKTTKNDIDLVRFYDYVIKELGFESVDEVKTFMKANNLTEPTTREAGNALLEELANLRNE